MTSTSMYVLLLCCLMLNKKGLGYNIQSELNEDASDSLDDEQQQTISKREVVPNTCGSVCAYAQDSINVYFAGKKLDGAIANSFEALGDGYAKDKWSVFYIGKKMDVSYDVSSFKALGNGYAKEKYNAYYLGKKMDVPYDSGFEALGNGYAKDKYNAYYLGKKMEGIIMYSSFISKQQRL